MSSDQELFRQILLGDLASFAQRALEEIAPGLHVQWNWHLDLICDRLTALARGEIKRLLVCVPPRSLKSTLCSVIYPAWLLARNPGEHVLCVSYGQALADDFGRQTRQLMEKPYYTRTFGTLLSADRRAAEQFETTVGGARIATSRQAVVTGRGGEFVIMDDIMKPEEAESETGREGVISWLRNTLISRSNNKADVRMMLVMQRLHEEDPAGHMLAQGGWETLILPAIATETEEHRYTVAGRTVIKRRGPGEPLHPERESGETLDEVRRDMSGFVFEAQYQQNPLPAAGNIVRRDWFGRYEAGSRPDMDRIIISVDTGLKTGAAHDYSVCIVLGQKDGFIYVLDVWRDKLEMPELCRKVIELGERYSPERVIVEDKGSGTPLMQALRALHFYKALPYVPRGDKKSRLHAVVPVIEGGYVLLPRLAHWLDTFLHEICGFPSTKHDDQVDALSQALLFFEVDSDPSGLFSALRQDLAAKDAREQNRTVRMKAPHNVSHFYGREGTCLSVARDRTIMLTEDDVGPALLGGFIRVT